VTAAVANKDSRKKINRRIVTLFGSAKVMPMMGLATVCSLEQIWVCDACYKHRDGDPYAPNQ
jgi:hypothetical protein